MRIGIGQLDIIWEDKNANKNKVIKLVKEANSLDINLLVFPEMTLTGFSFSTDIIEDFGCSPTIDFFKEISVTYKIAIAFGVVTSCSSKALNKLIIVKDGETIFDYSKIHPFSYSGETNYFESGNSISTCSIDNINIGGFICYDLRFPEIFQASSINNQVILVIANWPKKRVQHFRTLLSARAIENQCYIVGVNRVGSDPNCEYEGSCGIYSPTGELITTENNIESIIYSDIDIKLLENWRKEFPQSLDKQVELYKTLY